MKKVLALGAIAVVLGLSSVGAPVMAVSSTGVTAEASVVDAISAAEAALLATAGTEEVAAMRAYLQKWVTEARTTDLSRLSVAQLEELIAALNEGARGLRATAGVDRRAVNTTSEASISETVSVGLSSGVAASSSTASTSGAVSVTVPEPRTVKELPVSTTEVKEPVKSETKAEVASVATLADAGVAQVKRPVVAVAGEETASEVEVPKTGVNEEEEQASSAVRGIGLILGGAVVLAAAAGAVLIVKRMKRDA